MHGRHTDPVSNHLLVAAADALARCTFAEKVLVAAILKEKVIDVLPDDVPANVYDVCSTMQFVAHSAMMEQARIDQELAAALGIDVDMSIEALKHSESRAERRQRLNPPPSP
jgi:hypothetical protein